eukprot:gene12383-26050_t
MVKLYFSLFFLRCIALNSNGIVSFTNSEKKWELTDSVESCVYEHGPSEFLRVVRDSGSKTDKVQLHAYQEMYGTFLFDIRDRARAAGVAVKFFEIGLGCGCQECYGNGSSIAIWKGIFGTNLNLWVAEFDIYCIDMYRSMGILNGANVIAGDQAKKADVDRWINESGGNFNVIVDDGGHKNYQIKASFDMLWDSLLPGGLYFVEDIQVGRSPRFQQGQGQGKKAPAFIDVVHHWVEQLGTGKAIPRRGGMTIPLPRHVKWIMCQMEACVIAKK